MKKAIKWALTIISILFVLTFIGGIIAFKIFANAFETDCEKSNSWSVGTYEIHEYKCIGYAGPPFYLFHLYENGREIGTKGYKINDCTVQFPQGDEEPLKINVCGQ